tara:strand:+ start:116 stop:802 length:687 start_codon:yes stop_codon:yes gene_type:complete
MSSNNDSQLNADSDDPFALLGIEPGSTFEEIQKAREIKLEQVGDDRKQRAKIESSYDALLMSSLKERQLGKASNEAISASQREEGKSFSETSKSLGTSLLTNIRTLGSGENNSSQKVPFSFPEGQNLAIRISFGLLAIVLLLVSPPGSTQLILSLSTIALFISQVRSGRKFVSSLGWSVVLLSIGLIIGEFIVSHSDSVNGLDFPLAKEQIEALPALFLLWLGVLLLA